MIIGNKNLKQLIKTGQIVISPFNPDHLKSVGYTFTLGIRLRKLKSSKIVNPNAKPDFEEVLMGPDGFVLNPSEFVVAETVEKVTLNGKYCCLLSTRSGIAQIGLDVLQSSTIAEPDTDNVFTLEIINYSVLK